ncbi:MAG: acyl-ACP--UDP-N-acetylglucosamine O-acyltransferase [Alphaproteobacteria bacterium]|nr:acyl-ACP--UDP-N-acetylglucosamine O-acyltransferase [Alphaproteobacteria bacterium]
MPTNIHASAIVSTGAKIGNNVQIGPYCIIGDHVTLHDDTTLMSHVVIDGRTEVGEGTKIYPFACIGTPPQSRQHETSPDARLIIGKHNIIREYVTMQPGTEKDGLITTVGDHGLFMANSHVAHDCHIGNHVIMANCATIAGHVTVGDHATLGGLSAVHQFVHIGHHAFIGGTAGITNDIIPYAMVLGKKDGLAGLNLVGLKRMGVPRETIQEMVSAYNELFSDEDTLLERKTRVAEKYKHNSYVMDILNFINQDSKRSISLPAA